MAGDWLKMRSNLWDDPRVVAIADALDASEAVAIGCLFRLWSIADQHSEDGILNGMSTKSLDRKTGIPGFSEAAISAGWLEEVEGGLRIPRFDEHNGQSAKRRASDARAKASRRKTSAASPKAVRKKSASDADKSQTQCGREVDKERTECGARGREEKEKEQKGASAGPHEKAPTDRHLRNWAERIPSEDFGDLAKGDSHFASLNTALKIPWPDAHVARRRFLESWCRVPHSANRNRQQFFASLLIGGIRGDGWGGDAEDEAAVSSYFRKANGADAPADGLGKAMTKSVGLSAVSDDIRRTAQEVA